MHSIGAAGDMAQYEWRLESYDGEGKWRLLHSSYGALMALVGGEVGEGEEGRLELEAVVDGQSEVPASQRWTLQVISPIRQAGFEI